MKENKRKLWTEKEIGYLKSNYSIQENKTFIKKFKQLSCL